MRRIVMRDVIEAVDERVEREGPGDSPSARLAAELEHRIRDVVTDFIKAHDAELDPTTACTALLGAAAVQVMTLFDMDPDNFAELARATARLSLPEVAVLRERMRRTGIG